MTLAYLKGKDAESVEAQVHASKSSGPLRIVSLFEEEPLLAGFVLTDRPAVVRSSGHLDRVC